MTSKEDNPIQRIASFKKTVEISTSNRDESETGCSSDSISSEKDSKNEKQLNEVSRNQEYMKLARNALIQYSLLKNIDATGHKNCLRNQNKEKNNNNSAKINHYKLTSRKSGSRTYQNPTYFDVLCGRSKLAFDHPGNHIFRAKIAKCMDKYTRCDTRSGKTTIILSVISSVLNDGGHFLKYDNEKEQWYDGGLSTAKIRASTAFRDAGIPNKNKSIDSLRKKSLL